MKLKDITIAGIRADNVGNWLHDVSDWYDEHSLIKRYDLVINNTMLDGPHSEMFLVYGFVTGELLKRITEELNEIINELTGDDPNISRFDEDEVIVAIQAIGIKLFEKYGYKAEWWNYG